MNGRMKVAGIALVVVLITGLFGVVAVSAQDDDGVVRNFFGWGRGQMGGNAALVDSGEMHEAIAGALGISVEELETARAEGTSLWALVDELGADMAAVREVMTNVRQAAIDQALADGLITEEQAEWLLSRPAFGQGNGPLNGNGPGSGEGPLGGRGPGGDGPQGNAGHGHGRGGGSNG